MRTYTLWFVRDYQNIVRGTIASLPADEAIAIVNAGYAVYYVV